MENNFLRWLTTPITLEEIELSFNINNMIREKLELFSDFSFSLYNLVIDTYLGEGQKNITRITLTDQEKKNHFDWCWKKNIENFRKENFLFNEEGDHYDYFYNFFRDAYYQQKDEKVKKSIDSFFTELFTNFNNYTKSDLDMVTEIYKMLDKNLSYKKLY
jgi:hypothetical protein